MFSYPGQKKRRPKPRPTGPPPPLSDLSRWFDYYDTDRGGSLDREEVSAALLHTPPFNHRGADSVRETVYSVWAAFDHDGSGSIDKREFCAPGGLGESLLAYTTQHHQPPPPKPAHTYPPQTTHTRPPQTYQPYQPATNTTQSNDPDIYVPAYGSNNQTHQETHQYNSPAPSAPPVYSSGSSNTWNCQNCTFANSNTDPRCQMCNAAAPAGIAAHNHHQPAPAPYHQPAPAPYHQPAPAPYQQPNHHHQQPPSYQQPTHHQQPTRHQHQTQQSPQYQTMRINIPAGTVPGQRLKIKTPGGHEHMVTIPERHQWRSQHPPVFDVQVPVAPAVVVQAAPIHNPPPSGGHYAPAPPPKPAQTPWQSWESFRGHTFQQVPMATTNVPPHEISHHSSNIPASGRRKALLIGINYKGTRAALRGCVNDAKNIKNLLMENGFRDDPTHMVMLVDEGARNSNYLPTRANIMRGFQWLVQGVSEGDALFFHFSGHGSQVPDKSGFEEDGLNETILPVDYQKGQISDDVIWSSIVYPLPSGVKLTVIMDCCHSGTGLDLPFDYMLDSKRWVEDTNPAHSKGHVVSFSGCEDSQTSADTIEKYQAGGAMTQSFISAYRQNPMSTYPEFMAAIHRRLKQRGFKQRPQLTSSQAFDVKNTVFSFTEGFQPNKNQVIGRIHRKKIRPGSTGDRRQSGVNDLLFGGLMVGGALAFADALFG